MSRGEKGKGRGRRVPLKENTSLSSEIKQVVLERKHRPALHLWNRAWLQLQETDTLKRVFYQMIEIKTVHL